MNVTPISSDSSAASPTADDARPLVSLVLPLFNEAAILEAHFKKLEAHLATLAGEYRFEIILVNDGSRDGTGEIVDRLAATGGAIAVHHSSNFGLGQAFKTAFGICRGDYVVTMDIDLSYGPEHIDRLLAEIRKTRAKMVLASPYMKGGSISNVPPLRRVLSIWANRFLSLFAHGRLSTLTCMVRAYDGPFIRSLNLRSVGMEVMPETIYKTMILRGKIEQVPADLDWGPQLAAGGARRSSMRIIRHIFSTVLSGFLFRPFMFFVMPGLALMLVSLWINFWMIVHVVEAYASLGPEFVGDRIAAAVARAYELYPYSFLVGLVTLMLSIQLVSLGILALQTKSYFEEIFHLGSSIKRAAEKP